MTRGEGESVIKLSIGNWVAIISTIVCGIAANCVMIYSLFIQTQNTMHASELANNAAIYKSNEDYNKKMAEMEIRWIERLENAISTLPPAWVARDLEALNKITMEHERRLQGNETRIGVLERQVNQREGL